MRFREIEVIDNKLKRLYYEMKKFFRKIPAENLSGKNLCFKISVEKSLDDGQLLLIFVFFFI